jgi:hypothetical protein
MPEPPVVCAIDPGVSVCGVAVVSTQVRYSGTIAVPRVGAWPGRCRLVHDTVAGICRRFRPQVLAIELFHWQGTYATTEPPMLLLTGALCTVPGPEVVLIPPDVWQAAIVGTKPPHGPGATREAWKRLVRSRVELALIARGMRWRDGSPDPGGHRYDALALAMYCQDTARLAGLEARPGGRRLGGRR